MKRHDGFTLLELLVTLAIITLISAIIGPNFDEWVKKQTFRNGYDELRLRLSMLRSEALSRNTTSRMQLQQVGDAYVLTGYVAPLPVADCNPGGTWVEVSSEEIEFPDGYIIEADENVCFYRDGSSSGAQYDIDDDEMGIGSASITVTIATGYLDVIETN